MQKRILKIVVAILAVVFLLQGAVPEMLVMAAKEAERLIDEAVLLDETQKESLGRTLDEISEKQAFDVVILTVNSLGGKTAEAFADDYFDQNDYGWGERKDGILFLLSMENRDWAISTSGFGIDAFTDAGQEYIMEEILPYLSDGKYAKAFERFAKLCDQFLTQAREGEAYDIGNLPKGTVSWFWIPVDLLIGFFVAFCMGSNKKAKLKSVHKKTAAKDYVMPGSLRITADREWLVNRTVSSRVIERNHSGNGGSSTHTSSSGKTHGGSSGKF